MLNQAHTLLQSSSKKSAFIVHIKLSILFFSLSGCYLPPLYLDRESLSHTRQSLADYNLQLGLAYLEAGDRLKAKQKLLEAECQNPRNFRIKSSIAYFLEQAGEWQKAESYYLKALQLNNKDGATHNNYGRFLCERGHYKKAETHFLKAIEDSHYLNVSSAYENAGLCAMRAADRTKAIHYLKKALKHNTHLKKSWLALAQLHYDHEPLLADQYLQQHQKIASPSSLALELERGLSQKLNDKKNSNN